MTHEEVAILWKDANGWDVRGYTNTLEDLERFARLVAAKALEQRTWQGLTNNDLQPIAEEYRILFGSWVHDFARAIEAKLKEKNSA